MRSFLQEIKKTNDVFTVKKRVSTKYEIAAVTEKLDGSKAALFENIKGNKFKLVSNLVGSRDRFAQAIGSKKSDINQKIVKAISSAKKPKISASAKFFENSTNDISILPVVTHFQNESGPFITSSILYTRNQEKIGGLTASIGTNTIPITTSIIPAKSESLFLKLISEQLSSIITGINLVSAFIPKKLENNTAKILIGKIKEIVEK